MMSSIVAMQRLLETLSLTTKKWDKLLGATEEVLSALEMPLSQFWQTHLATMWQQEMLE